MPKNKKISLGIDARVLFRKNIRGMGRYLKNIVQKVPDDFEITLYGEKEYQYLLTIDLPVKVSVKTFNLRGYRFQLWEQIGLPFYMLKERHDIFFSPATTAPLIHPCKLVVTLHDIRLWVEKKFGNLNWYYQNIIPKALERANFIITISEFSKKEILDMFPNLKEKVEVIYHGIDNIFHPNYKLICDKLHFKISKPYIIYIGGESKKKRPFFALEIFKKILTEFSNMMLIMIGISEQGKDIIMKKIKDLNISSKVAIAPPLTDEQLAMLYANAELVLYPTLHEGFGFPILEAMASKTPIVASRVASLPEISGGHAFLIDPHNYQEWQQTVLFILKNKNKSELITKIEAAFFHAQKFSWQITINKTYDLFRRVYYGS